MEQLSLFGVRDVSEPAEPSSPPTIGASAVGPSSVVSHSFGPSVAGPEPELDLTSAVADPRVTLRRWLGPKVLVKLTQNQSTMISFRERRGVLYLRLHAMFVEAPAIVLGAVAAFVSGEGYTKREAKLLDDWIEANRPERAQKPRRPPRPIGEVHDLQSIFDELNRRWFDDCILAQITWGESRTKNKGARSSMQLGAYDEDASEIRIHPALDQDWVPEFFVASVVFHEMLHEKHDAPVRNGRRVVHSARFLAEERRYPDYERARQWEAAHLDRLLAY